MNDTERAAAQATLATLSGAATAAGAVLTGVGGIVARVISAALGVASAMLSQGATPQQAVDAIKRVRHIDTSADDAAVDLKVDAKPLGKRYQEMRPVMQAVPAVDEPSPFDRQAAPVCGVCGHEKGPMRLSGRGAWACVNPRCESPPQAKRHEPGEGD